MQKVVICMKRSGAKKMLITNLGIALIIGFVYVMAFMPFGEFHQSPWLKGNTGGNNVALQIVVEESSDVVAYMNMLEGYGVPGTFFFSRQHDNKDMIKLALDRGHGIGFYMCGDDQFRLYLGGGYSVPVMSYGVGGEAMRVCPSIDSTKLISTDDWQQVLSEAALSDMFISCDADNNLEDFEKIVQIVLDKGYTILKVNEML